MHFVHDNSNISSPPSLELDTMTERPCSWYLPVLDIALISGDRFPTPSTIALATLAYPDVKENYTT